MALPPIDKIVESVGVGNNTEEAPSDTHTVFKKGEPPKVYKGTSGVEKKQEIKPSGSCSSQWTRKQYTKEGAICYNRCNEEVACK